MDKQNTKFFSEYFKPSIVELFVSIVQIHQEPLERDVLNHSNFTAYLRMLSWTVKRVHVRFMQSISARNFHKPPANGSPESPVESFGSRGIGQLPDRLVCTIFRLKIDRHREFGSGFILRTRFPPFDQGINFSVDEVHGHVLLITSRRIS